MKRLMYGYEYDFMERSGTELVLSREAGLRREEMQQIELRMLEACSIPNTLAFEAEEIDLQVRLRYEIGGRRMLSQWMRTEKLAPQAYFRLLLQITAVLDESKTYFLREEGYWLAEDFIFIGEHVGDISLLYVPVRDIAGKPPVRDQIKDLAGRLAGTAAETDSERLSALMSFLYRQRFDFDELKHFLGLLLTEGPGGQPVDVHNGGSGETHSATLSDEQVSRRDRLDDRQREPQSALPRKKLPEWITAGEGGIARQTDRDVDPAEETMTGRHSALAAEERQLAEQKPEAPRRRIDFDPLRQGLPVPDTEDGTDREQYGGIGANAESVALPVKHAIYIGVSALAVLLLIWSLYPEGADEAAFYIWLGMTILVLDVVFVFVRIRPRFLRNMKELPIARTWNAMEEREMTGLTGFMPVPSTKGAAQPSKEPSAYSSGDESRFPKLSAHSETRRGEEAGVQRGSSRWEQTVLLRPLNETVLLNSSLSDQSEDDANESARPIAWLETKEQGGGTKRLDFKGRRFVIGREPELADYIAAEAGVSKLHLEIFEEDEAYYAKDLGSKNGTTLNKTKMVPYKLYPLTEGDVLQVIASTFVFCVGAGQRMEKTE